MTSGHYKTEGKALTIAPNGQATTQPISASGELTTRDAMKTFGTQYVGMFQGHSDDTRGTLARFPGTVAADARAHPWGYVFKAAEVGALFVPGAQEYEGLKLSVELHVAAVELIDALGDK